MRRDSRPGPEDLAGPDDDVTVPDPRLRTIALVRWGIVLWLVALVVLLVVPLPEGRDWWVWVPVVGAVLGLVGQVYLARGRGNAQFA